ncbi:MAG: phosphatidate cytidylyltransferase [Phycisphaerales bacterium]|jgi:phosphatidate cytidylyltransferase|nr:phosphatidate cytidylyltransferase [Phycisphaerales bacterium]
MLSKRLVTGPVLVAVLLLVVWLDEQTGGLTLSGAALPPGLPLLIICLVASVFAGLELSRVAAASGRRAAPVLTIVGSGSLLVAMWTGGAAGEAGWAVLVTLGLWFASMVVHAQGKRTEGVLADAAVTTGTALYVGIGLGFYLLLREDLSAWWIAAIVLITKSCDIGAYFTGCSIGRHKLIPWLSPGKTVEGLIGGCITAILVSVAASHVLADAGFAAIGWPLAAVLGLVLAVAGQGGDLTMSLLKRGCGAKDSASTLPGMGGVMDVLDSILLAGPVAWLVLTLAGVPATP